MNPSGRLATPRRRAFTIVELLVVLVIIGILAALLVPLIKAIDRRQKISLARAQLHQVAAAIEAYKTKLGFYPPDNPGNPAINQLYFELLGTTNNGTGAVPPTSWVTLDHSAQINAASISTFGVQGLANTAPRARSDDQATAATSFLDSLDSKQFGLIGPQIKILVCSIEWPAGAPSSPITGTQLNPWCYNSSHPTNNAGSYDLWVDLVIGGTTYRISNWNQ